MLAACVVEVGSETGSHSVGEPAESGVWWDNARPELATCVETDGHAGRYFFARKGVGIELNRELRVTAFGASDSCKSYDCPDRGYRGTIAPGIGEEAESPIYFYRPVRRDHRVLRVIAAVHPLLTFYIRFPVEPNRTGTCAEAIRAWLAEGTPTPTPVPTPTPEPAPDPVPDPDPAPACADGACSADDEGLCDGAGWLCEGGCWWWIPEWCGETSEGGSTCADGACGADQEGLCDGSGWRCEVSCWIWAPEWCAG